MEPDSKSIPPFQTECDFVIGLPTDGRAGAFATEFGSFAMP